MFKFCDSEKCKEPGATCRCRIGLKILMVVLFVLVLPLIVQALWNWLVPVIFIGAVQVTYLQALGLVLLGRLLAGHCGYRRRRHGWGGHHGSHSHDDCCGGGKDESACCTDDWAHYDAWWKEEGEASFKKYAESKKAKN